MGRDTFFSFGNDRHHPRIFTAHVGRTAIGRKGTSQKLVEKLVDRINEIEPGLLCAIHRGGLSTKEGLAKLVHDGHGETAAIKDKRLWVQEDEFYNVLKKIKQAESTLEQGICHLWDGRGISPLALSNKIGVKEPHVGIHANITDFQIKVGLTINEAQSGMANRFLFFWAEKTSSVPRPTNTDNSIIDGLARELMEIVKFAKGGYPESKDNLEMHYSDAAWDYWDNIYNQLDNFTNNAFIDGILQRKAMQTLRLAMLFALMDKTRVIEPRHLQAAFAWLNYCVDSVKYIFQDKANNPQQAVIRVNAVKIMAFLRLRPEGASLTEINNACFQKHSSGAEIEWAIKYLLAENPPKIKQIIGVSGSKGGAKKRTYKVVSGADKRNNCLDHATHGLEGDLQGADKLRNNSGQEQQDSVIPRFSASAKSDLKPETAGAVSFSVFPHLDATSADPKTKPKQPTRPRKPRTKKGVI